MHICLNTQSICTLISNLPGQPDFFRVWNFKNYKVASTLFFQGLHHAFFVIQKRRGQAAFSLFKQQQQKVLILLFAPYFLNPIFWTPFFQGCKPTHVLNSEQWVPLNLGLKYGKTQESVYKSNNLQYNTMVHCFTGTNDSSTKYLMFQVLFLFIFHNFLQNSLQKSFQFFFSFFL